MRNRKPILILACILALTSLFAQEKKEVYVSEFKYAGPFELNTPIVIDSMNVNGKKFDVKNLLKSSYNYKQMLRQSTILEADTAHAAHFSAPTDKHALHLLSFYLNSDRYTTAKLEVTGPEDLEVMVDGKTVGSSSDLKMEPRRYEVVVKYLSAGNDTVKSNVKALVKADEKAEVTATLNPEKHYSLQLMMEGVTAGGGSLSPNGKYVLINITDRMDNGTKSDRRTRLVETATGKVVLEANGWLNEARWLPTSNKLYYMRTGSGDGRELVTVDPQTLQESVLATNLPDGSFSIAPNETTLIYAVREEGPKEGKELIRVLEPRDRVPGFRNRSFLWKYDLNTGVFEQLFYGHNSIYTNDISQDSRKMLVSTSQNDYTKLPFNSNSLYCIDLVTMKIDTIWENKEYVNRAIFSPDEKKLLVMGSGNAFDNIGLNIKEGQLSNTYDMQLFLYDPETEKATALTKDFNPNVAGYYWSKYDGQIYFSAEDEDYIRIFTCNPQSGAIKPMSLSEDVIGSFSFSKTAPMFSYSGQSLSNANRVYVQDLKKKKETMLYDASTPKLDDVVFGEVHDWDFTSDNGTRIQGRYYLPPHFDANKKYPMIVYYYGGTSPTNRALESRYSMHMYAAQGYVVYTLNPSGTTGFGQEFAARHVNAWGIETADEIIKGTEQFCEEHPFVDKKKIGCIGASYGGFMTQYLQTKTDLFAAAVSHAGISALSSYWGEGYWGYGYCAAANTGTYPWNNPEFFTKQSPLFNADKIKTPLLLLHGNADTNVPVGESIQMFAAMKILGKEVEMVLVEGEDHGIVAPAKRIGWQNSIFAWFARWLKDQPEYWNEMYPERHL